MDDVFMAQPDEQVFSPGTDSPTDSPTVTEEKPTGQAEDKVEEVPEDLDDRPLHKDRRFKQVIEERNRLREEREALLREQAEFYKSKAETPTKKGSEKPTWFTKYFGDDEEAWEGFHGMTEKAKEEAKKEAIEAYKAEQAEAQDSVKRANEWVEEQVKELKDSGEDFDKNALFKVMEKYRPTDAEGNLDFKAGLELLKLQQPDAKEKTQARRKLADGLNSKPGKTEPTERNYQTAASLRKAGGWDSIYE